MQRLEVWTGPVSAAKTEGVMRTLRRRIRRPSRREPQRYTTALLIRPERSRRDEEGHREAVSKDGNAWPCFYIRDTRQILDLVRQEDPDILWIDEPFFFPTEQLPGSTDLFGVVQEIRSGRDVFVSGIGASNNLEPLGGSFGKIMQVADRIHHEVADCDFCEPGQGLDMATRSVYVGETPKTDAVQLGGEESYRPACPECYNLLEGEDLDTVRAKLMTIEMTTSAEA